MSNEMSVSAITSVTCKLVSLFLNKEHHVVCVCVCACVCTCDTTEQLACFSLPYWKLKCFHSDIVKRKSKEKYTQSDYLHYITNH